MTTTPAPSIAASLLTGTATGPFPTGFKYDAAENVRVYLELAGVRQADLTAVTDYTLTGATPKVDGGTVTLSAALVPDDGWDEAAGDRVVIYRRTVKSQALFLPNSEGHKPAATEAALDKQMRALEELADQDALAVKAPVGEAGVTLSPAASRAGSIAVWSDDGTSLRTDRTLVAFDDDVELARLKALEAVQAAAAALANYQDMLGIQASGDQAAAIAARLPKNTDGSDFAFPELVRDALGAAKAEALAQAAIDRTVDAIEIHSDEISGDDVTGDGSALNPYATFGRALEAVPLLTARASVRLVPHGDVTDSWRTVMDRSALGLVDGIKAGRRTDAPGTDMTGGLIVDLTDAIMKPGTGFARAIYATGHVGSVAVLGGQVDSQLGCEAMLVAHRGVYIHCRDTVFNGNGIAPLGVVCEAGGWFEGVDVVITGCVSADFLVYDGSFGQLAAPGGVGTVGKVNINGIASFAVGQKVTGNIINRGLMRVTGGSALTPVLFSGNYDGKGGRVLGSHARITNAAASWVAQGEQWQMDALHSDAVLYFRAMHPVLNAFQSYVAPATQSTHARPVILLEGAELAYSASLDIVNASGLLVGPSYLPPVITVAADATVIAPTFTGRHMTVRLNNTKGSLATGCTLSLNSGWKASQRVADGQRMTLVSLGGNGVQIVHDATLTGCNGSAVVIGAAVGQYRSATFEYLTDHGKWMLSGVGQVVV